MSELHIHCQSITIETLRLDPQSVTSPAGLVDGITSVLREHGIVVEKTSSPASSPESRVVLADCLSILQSRVEQSASTRRDYLTLTRRWRDWHLERDREEPDIREIGDGDFAVFAGDIWSNLRTQMKNAAYFCKLLRCRTPRRSGFHWGDDPDEAILERVPLTGLENQSIPKTLEKASRTLTVEEVSQLVEAGAKSGWPVPVAETWAAFYGIAWLCGIRPDDLVRLEHDGERSRVDLETQTLHFISSKRNVPVHLPLPSWLFPIVEFLVEDARQKERLLLFPFTSRTHADKAVSAESITTRVKRHYEAAGVEPIMESGRKLWLYGFRKTSVTWWLTHHPGWQKQVNGHSVVGDVAKANYAQHSALKPLVEQYPVPATARKLASRMGAVLETPPGRA